MKLLKAFSIVYFVYLFASASTTIHCSNQTGKMKSQFKFSYNPANLEIETSFDGSPLPSYIFLSETMACGRPLQVQDKCSVHEFKNAVQPGDYDFQFSCSDGRRGELHYENGSVMAYCYRDNSLANQRGASACTISF